MLLYSSSGSLTKGVVMWMVDLLGPSGDRSGVAFFATQEQAEAYIRYNSFGCWMPRYLDAETVTVTMMALATGSMMSGKAA